MEDFSNRVFMHFADAWSNPRKARLKGYYICPSHGEFIKAAGCKEAPCPFCNKTCDRILTLNPVQEQITTSIWKDGGYYSALRADRKEDGAA